MKPLIVTLEANSEKGQDSHLIQTYGDSFVMAIFDGLGGRRGGDIASLEAKEMTHKCFNQLLKNNHSKIPIDEKIIDYLQKSIENALKAQAGNNIKHSRIKGTMSGNPFSTTLALVSIPQTLETETLTLDIAWIGDSRIYFLSPNKGLQQLTEDDSLEPEDAFHSTSGTPMSQYLTATMQSDWKINFKHEFIEEGLIIACTDGCFDGLKPWDFEKLLLENLINSKSYEDWKILIETSYVKRQYDDDVTLLLLPILLENFSEIQSAFKTRYEQLYGIYSTVNIQKNQLNDKYLELWETYRQNYEARLRKESSVQHKTEKLAKKEDTTPAELPEFLIKRGSQKSGHTTPPQTPEEIIQGSGEMSISEKSKQQELGIIIDQTKNDSDINNLLRGGKLRLKQRQYTAAIGQFILILSKYNNHIEALSYLALAWYKEAEEEDKSFAFIKNQDKIQNLYNTSNDFLSKILSIFEEYKYIEKISHEQSIYSEVTTFINIFNQVENLSKLEFREELVIQICEKIQEINKNETDFQYALALIAEVRYINGDLELAKQNLNELIDLSNKNSNQQQEVKARKKLKKILWEEKIKDITSYKGLY